MESPNFDLCFDCDFSSSGDRLLLSLEHGGELELVVGEEEGNVDGEEVYLIRF